MKPKCTNFLENTCSLKDTLKRNIRHRLKENILYNISDKDFVSRRDKEHLELNSKKTNNN